MKNKTEKVVSERIQDILSDQIIEPLTAMRQSFDSEYISELSQSIKKDGLINRITVRPVHVNLNKEDCTLSDIGIYCDAPIHLKYEIVAGHCRFKAMCQIPWPSIPCVVKQMTDEQVATYRIQENLLRDEVRPVDQAMYYQSLIGEDFDLVAGLAKQLGKSEKWLEDRLLILTYPEYFFEPLNTGKVKLGVAKALAEITDDYYRKMFFDNAVRDGMTIWQAEYYLSQWKQGIFKKGEEIVPPTSADNPSQVAIIKQECEKCLKMAYAPNLKSVFIHIECPEDIQK